MSDKKVPRHVGIIMDGNGRWATLRGLKRSEGHKAGYETIKNLSKVVFKKGIEVLSIYAFSTENFKRSDEEVNYLMNLFIKGFKELKKTYNEDNIRLVFSGRREPLRKDVLKSMDKITEATKDNTGGTLNICLNYDGRAEIVDTTKKLIEMVNLGKLEAQDINEEIFRQNLYQNLPPVDLLIRTSGEYRLSGFMLYNSSYSEYYFTNVLFPDFNIDEFDKVLNAYNKRDRRFGGIKKSIK